MHEVFGRGLMLVGACMLVAACSGSSDTTSGSATGGAAGSATGGAGGSATGGAGGSATGGAGGSTADTFWPDSYDATALSNPASGNHNAGKDCGNCHTGGGAPAWSYAGTVYQTGGMMAAPHVEVGVRYNGTTYTTYSGTNGNFFYTPGVNIDFTQAEVRIRNGNGEATMPGSAGQWCNSCHSSGSRIIEP